MNIESFQEKTNIQKSNVDLYTINKQVEIKNNNIYNSFQTIKYLETSDCQNKIHKIFIQWNSQNIAEKNEEKINE